MIRRLGGFLASCALAASSLTAADIGPGVPATDTHGDVEQVLLELEQEWVAAENHHDAATLRRILDDQFVNTFGTGELLDKEAFIAAVTSGELDPSLSQTLSDRTTVIAGDTAIVVGTDTVRRTREGKTVTTVFRYTVTYIRRQGRWTALAEHMVRVPPAE
jgi:ketosteroid isomerase-like protein